MFDWRENTFVQFSHWRWLKNWKLAFETKLNLVCCWCTKTDLNWASSTANIYYMNMCRVVFARNFLVVDAKAHAADASLCQWAIQSEVLAFLSFTERFVLPCKLWGIPLYVSLKEETTWMADKFVQDSDSNEYLIPDRALRSSTDLVSNQLLVNRACSLDSCFTLCSVDKEKQQLNGSKARSSSSFPIQVEAPARVCDDSSSSSFRWLYLHSIKAFFIAARLNVDYIVALMFDRC